MNSQEFRDLIQSAINSDTSSESGVMGFDQLKKDLLDLVSGVDDPPPG